MTFPKHQSNLLSRSLPALLLAVALLPLTATAQTYHPVTGRRIAPVMGMSGADWLNRPEREREEDTALAIRELHLQPGMVVADIGAGTGYYSIRIARRILPGGKVLANDIQPEMLRRLKANAEAANVANIETILGTESDPNLPANSVDLVIMVDVYHELSRPQRILGHIRAALKPNGKLVLLEYRKEDPGVPIRPEHEMSLAEVKAEVEPEGYRFEQGIETLPLQHIIFFRKALPN
jgi:SAM-dependent methyltransferase